jgi:type I restriction enzyme S subunit
VSKYPLRPLSDAISLDIDEILVDPGQRYPIAGVHGFGRGLFHRESILGSQTSYKKLYRLHAGHIVMSRLKAFEGAVSYIPERFDGSFLSSEFPTFEVKEEAADAQYVSHICGWPGFWSLLQQGSRGIGARRERVSAERFLSIKVPLPDLGEQRRIASKIGSMSSSIKEVGALNSGSAGIGESLLWSIIPTDARSVRLANLVAPVMRREATDHNKTYRMLGVRWYAQGAFVRETKIGRDIAAKSVFRVECGDFIYNRLFAWKGSFALISETMHGCHVSDEFPTFRVDSSEACPQYIMLVFRMSDIWQAALLKSSGSTPTSRNRLRVDDFLSIEIPLPDLKTQSKIAARAGLVIRAGRLSKHRQVYSDALQSSILNAAFTGQL